MMEEYFQMLELLILLKEQSLVLEELPANIETDV